MRKALILVAALGLLTLSGCEIYFGTPDDDTDCNDWGGCEDPSTPPPWEPPPPDGGDGTFQCWDDWSCAAGCYCEGETPNSPGSCVEAGFCVTNDECGEGYTCDEYRNSCVPDTGAQCNTDLDCLDNGGWCDTWSGVCVDPGQPYQCTSDAECGGGGFICDNGACIQWCDEDADCFQGCVCDLSTNSCIETGFCQTDYECPNDMACDTDRATCDTPEAPTVACELLTDANQCLSRADCQPIYVGQDCSCVDGSNNCDCSASPDSCTCESYRYAGCAAL